MGVAFGLMLALAFSAGFLVRDFVDTPSVFATNADDDSEGGYLLIDEVQSLLDAHYLGEQPDYTTRQYGAIRGMLGVLEDRNTFFIEPPVARSESDVLAGTYGGIGVSLSRNIAGEFILAPFPDSPAMEAGIRDGDVLIAINGTPIDFSTQQDVVDQLLRGEVDGENGVEITTRNSTGETTQFIVFDVINVPSVIWRIIPEDSSIGYIQILRFTNRTPSELETAIQELSDAGALAYIVDVRNNGGGLLQEAIEVASIFLDGGPVLHQMTATGEQTFNADPGGSLIEGPIVMLVNNGTASAAELVAGALQDRGRATLIGQQTYGKGTIQQIFSLSDSSSIHITSAEWFTPERNALDGVGLTPDITMIPDESGRDVELGEALRYLRATLVEMGMQTS